MSEPEYSDLPADCLPGDAIAVLLFHDQRPLAGPVALLDWRLDGQLTRLLLDGRVKGKAGEHLVLQNNGKLAADWILCVGGGSWYGMSRDTHSKLIMHLLEVASRAGFRDLSICLEPFEEAPANVLREQVSEALNVKSLDVTRCRLSCTA